ncbi:MAG: SDR family oxidoreductase [Dehalococcoidia bacterium]|nr:SDR family oxidoreductase [Dehalococcoidia bacterium]
MGLLDGKVAIITGSGQGIGRGIAIAFAKEGASIVIVEVNAERGADAAKELQALGARALVVDCDVRVQDQVNRAVAATVKEFGTVDILVNNVQMRRYALLEDVKEEYMMETLQSGPIASLFFMQACLPHFKEKQAGKVINVGSGAALTGLEGWGAYSIAKNAILCLTRVAAREWGQYGINVNSFCPFALTPSAIEGLKEKPEFYKKTLEGTPLRRIGDPEKDVGRAVVFLASSASDYVTGQCLPVDGGHDMVQ